MSDELRDLIQKEFGECLNCKQVAELYSDIKAENQKQMEFMMDFFENEQN